MTDFEDELLLDTLRRLDATVGKLSDIVEGHSRILAIVEEKNTTSRHLQMLCAALIGGFASTLLQKLFGL